VGRLKLTGSALIVGLAVLATCASVASASKPKLVLREGGPHLYEGLDPALPEGALVEERFETALGGCSTTTPSRGTVVDNDAVEDLVRTETQRMSCGDEYEGKRDEFEFSSDWVELEAKGKLVRFGPEPSNAGLEIVLWGPYGPGSKCRYHFSLIKTKTSFPVPAPGSAGSAVLSATAKSIGHQEPPNKLCPKKEAIAFTVTLADNGGYPLETTLEG